MGNSDSAKKGRGAKTAASTVEVGTSSTKNNLFSRHGNQQIAEVIQQARQEQRAAPSLLASLEEQVQPQRDEEEQTQLARRSEESEVKEESSAKPPIPSAAMAAVSNGSERVSVPEKLREELAPKGGVAAAMLAQADAEQLEEVDKARRAAGGRLTEEQAMLAMASAKGLDEEKKAEMLLASGKEIDLAALKEESGELRARVLAEELPPELAGFAEKAAREAADAPLSERDTIKNVTDHIQRLAMQIANYPQLTDPQASVEEKATRLVEVLAYELDVPTRESVGVHLFEGLIDDMIFDPRGLMEINRIAGNRRDVRTIGSFGVVLWQCAVDATRRRLDNLDDKTQINEGAFLAGIFNEMANQMYTDALAKPTGA